MKQHEQSESNREFQGHDLGRVRTIEPLKQSSGLPPHLTHTDLGPKAESDMYASIVRSALIRRFRYIEESISRRACERYTRKDCPQHHFGRAILSVSGQHQVERMNGTNRTLPYCDHLPPSSCTVRKSDAASYYRFVGKLTMLSTLALQPQLRPFQSDQLIIRATTSFDSSSLRAQTGSISTAQDVLL